MAHTDRGIGPRAAVLGIAVIVAACSGTGSSAAPSQAASAVVTGQVVRSSHSIGLVSVGGALSRTRTAATITVGKCSVVRCRGGRRATAWKRTLR